MARPRFNLSAFTTHSLPPISIPKQQRAGPSLPTRPLSYPPNPSPRQPTPALERAKSPRFDITLTRPPPRPPIHGTQVPRLLARAHVEESYGRPC
ncbi:hypothetical protein ACJQWK_02521 [Exserohilum turcicum]